MGKQSRIKKERRRNREVVVSLTGGYTPLSLLPLLDAASISPTAAHRSSSISMLFLGCALTTSSEGVTASNDVLPSLLNAVYGLEPNLRSFEDFVPYDSRSEVLARWGQSLLRIVSGALERPTAVVDKHAFLAEVLDPILVGELGFGLSDVGEIVLRRIDDVARTLAPHWSNGPQADVGDPPQITAEEADAAKRLKTVEELIDECSYPERARAVLTHYTVSGSSLRADITHPTSTFGNVLAVRMQGHHVFLPVGNLLDSMSVIGAELSEFAAARDEAEKWLEEAVSRRVTRLLAGTGHELVGPMRINGHSQLHALVAFSDQQFLAIHIASGTSAKTIQQRLDEGRDILKAATRPGQLMQGAQGTWRLPESAEIIPLHITAGPTVAAAYNAYGPVLSMEDLCWILRSTAPTKENLWYFVRDIHNSKGAQAMFAWDRIDQWEVWNQGKTFHNGGVAIPSMFFQPHAAIAEWEAAAAFAPVEKALQALRLPPVREWPIVDSEKRDLTYVADLARNAFYVIVPGPVPVAIAQGDMSGPTVLRSLLWDLAVGIAWKIQHCPTEFGNAARQSLLAGLRIEFAYQKGSGTAAPLTSGSFDDGVLTIAWNEGLQEALLADSTRVESICGEIIAQALGEADHGPLIAAWRTAPPGIRIDGISVPQRAQSLPRPTTPQEATQNDTIRALGSYLAANQVAPGRYEGSQAASLESQTIFPKLLVSLHEVMSPYSGAALLHFALEQLERANSHRFFLDKKIAWQRGFPTGGATDGAELAETASRLIRSISLIVEELIAHPTSGSSEVGDAAWGHILAVADLSIESCMRSAAIHHRLSRTATEITDLYEVHVVDFGEPVDVDVQEYHKVRSALSLPAAVPIRANQSEDDDVADPEPRPITETEPALVAVDQAMRENLGFGLDAATGILNVACQWEVSPQAPTALVRVESIIDTCSALVVGCNRNEYEKALNWMTLTPGDLINGPIPHWETERRAKRLTTSPFLLDGDGLWVMPWTAGMALRIFVNYLSDGRLPWPNPALPKPVVKALDQYRQSRNRQLELESVAALEQRGFRVFGGIKPEKLRHYGISNLRGEIDALCIDDARSRMWVIEAKDPYTPYSSYQMRRLVDDFLGPKKYVDKLLAKVQDIEVSAVSLAERLKVPDPSRTWQVVGLMLTRYPDPAAFAVDPKVPFCVLENLVHVVDQDGTPEPGFQAVTAYELERLRKIMFVEGGP